MGFSEVVKNAKIKDYYGKEINVDVACRLPGAKYEIALQKNENKKYDMVCDWWGIRRSLPDACKNQGINNDSDLQDAILRHTTKHTIIRKYKRDGFRAEVTEDENHNIRLKLTRAS